MAAARHERDPSKPSDLPFLARLRSWHGKPAETRKTTCLTCLTLMSALMSSMSLMVFGLRLLTWMRETTSPTEKP